MADPTFSIVVTTRNRSDLLKTALDSIAEQTFSDYECIVVDDGSDSNHAMLNRELVRSHGPRFRLLNFRPPGSAGSGPAPARNHGIFAAKGQLITFLDDDDYFIDREHLNRMSRVFSRSDIDLCLLNYRVYSSTGVVVERQLDWATWLRAKPLQGEQHLYLISHSSFSKLLRHCSPAPSTMVIRASLIAAGGAFYDWLRGWAEDFNLWCRLASFSRQIMYCDLPVISYRTPQKDSVSLTYNSLEQCFNELGASIHARLSCANMHLRKAARAREAWIYRALSLMSAQRGERRDALRYALQSCLCRLTIGSVFFMLRSVIKALTFHGSSKQSMPSGNQLQAMSERSF